MKETDRICSSCKVEITNYDGSVQFKCPACTKTTITRCRKCREIVAKYKCHDCGFVGPN